MRRSLSRSCLQGQMATINVGKTYASTVFSQSLTSAIPALPAASSSATSLSASASPHLRVRGVGAPPDATLKYALASPLQRAQTDFLRRLGGMCLSPTVLVLHTEACLPAAALRLAAGVHPAVGTRPRP